MSSGFLNDRSHLIICTLDVGGVFQMVNSVLPYIGVTAAPEPRMPERYKVGMIAVRWHVTELMIGG